MDHGKSSDTLIVDLAKFSSRVRNKPGGAKFGDAVEAYNDSIIVRRGLETAALLLSEGALRSRDLFEREDPTDSVGHSIGTVGGALISQAIIIYTRVTHGSGTLKNKLTRSEMTPSQAAVHDRILILRNEVVAHHVHKTKHPQGPWDKQLTLFVPEHKFAPIRYAYMSTNFRANDANDFVDLVNDLISVSIAKQNAAFANLEKEFETFYNANRPTMGDLANYAADLSGFSSQFVGEILTDPPLGHTERQHGFTHPGGMKSPE